MIRRIYNQLLFWWICIFRRNDPSLTLLKLFRKRYKEVRKMKGEQRKAAEIALCMITKEDLVQYKKDRILDRLQALFDWLR